MRMTVLLAFAFASGAQAAPYAVTVDTTRALNSFSPVAALGAGVDGVPYHAVPDIYTPANVQAMLGAGLGAVSYRLYTELSVQDWHWNPAGAFSESGGAQGYWTSSATPGAQTVDTFGYRLPRRGFTHDQGNDDDYSRLDDGDTGTFWKSNPYLSAAYTGDTDAAHAQWVLVDLGAKKTVNAARIAWASPWAVQYRVQYWTGDDAVWDAGNGSWVDFPKGVVSGGAGGTVTLDLGTAPGKVEFVRVVMSDSSGTCTPGGGADARDCVGYAIGEIGFGTLDGNGVFSDLVVHSTKASKQTATYASSVDPWHRSADRVTDQEQPGLDIVFQSGVTRGVPATVPVPMLYSTPANAAAELAYLEARGFAVARVEMGEEPDGQFVLPEDYAALYVQFAAALHAVDAKLQLGGPVFESNLQDWKAWPDANGETSWTKRFVAYLQAHGRLGDLGFFSFEHYPFGGCKAAKIQDDLLREPGLVQRIMDIWRADNLPAGLPMFITEMNYSQNETDAAQKMAGALWYADVAGGALSAGGAGLFLYEYEPIPLDRSSPCKGFGSYGILLGDRSYTAQAPLSQYYAAQMLTQQWAQPVDAAHSVYAAAVKEPKAWVTAYALQRPDGLWSVLLVNRDLGHAHEVTVTFHGAGGDGYFAGAVTQASFGPAQYGWVENGRQSHPAPDDPPLMTQVSGGAGVSYTVPAGTLVVLRGQR